MLDVVLFSPGNLNFKHSIQSTCVINLPQMCCLSYPEVDEPFMVRLINVIQKWQHHPTVVPIQQEEWMADASMVPTHFIKVFEHLHQKSSCDATFEQSPIKAGNHVFQLIGISLMS